jgi:MarR family transcriptional regulator, organic hydroperoxide resistance regulator
MATKALAATQQEFLPEWQAILAPHGWGYRMRLVSMLLTREFQSLLDPYGLTPFHWVVLCCLWQEDGLATSALADKLQQVGGTLTGVLDRMEERGLVCRQRDERDRRIWRIWLTETGEELRYVLPPLALELKNNALAGIPEPEQQRFFDVLDQIIFNLS